MNWIPAIPRVLGLRRTGTPNFRRMYKAANRALMFGNPVKALQLLGPWLGYPPTPELDDPAMWHDAMELFAEIVTALDIDGGLAAFEKSETSDTIPPHARNGLAFLLRVLADKQDDFETLCAVGRALPSESLAGIGCMFLSRASRLAPKNGDAIGDLAIHLLDIRAYSEATRILTDAHPLLDNPPRLRYVLTWAYLHQGDIFKARTQWQLRKPPEDDRDRGLHQSVDGIMQRVEAYGQVAQLTERDLRGWNFAFNGSFLLHLSPAGEEIMNGRYGAIFDSEALCLEGIQRLAAVLHTCQLDVQRVFMVPDHDSQVLATATARFLDRELAPWPDEGSEKPGLIVLHDLNKIDPTVLQTIIEHRPGQLLWAHGVSWMMDHPVGPDFISYLYEHLLSPWEKRHFKFESIPRQRTGPIDQLADSIVNAPLQTGELDDLPDLCAWIASLPNLPPENAPGAFRSQGTRRVFFADSPVHSNSFRDVL